MPYGTKLPNPALAGGRLPTACATAATAPHASQRPESGSLSFGVGSELIRPASHTAENPATAIVARGPGARNDPAV